MTRRLGKTLGEILKKLYGHVVPDLYPKLEMGSRPLKGDEAEDFLKAADLKALPPVFYAGEKGLGLVVKDGPKFVPNPAADVAKEVLDYLMGEHGYGNQESRTGKALEKRFGGIGYGWDRDMLRLILAVLFRPGRSRSPTGAKSSTATKTPAAARRLSTTTRSSRPCSRRSNPSTCPRSPVRLRATRTSPATRWTWTRTPSPRP